MIRVEVIKATTELSKVNEELAKHQNRLEELVEERTSELKKAQEELVKKERLATLGQLVAVVSHEIRNPLGTVASSIYTIKEKLQDSEYDVSRQINRAERNIKRCDGIIEELLDYGRTKELYYESTDFDSLIAEILDDEGIQENIEIISYLESDVAIKLDRARFRRCVINLLSNAYQAIHEKKLLSTADRFDPVVTIKTFVDNSKLKLQVIDNGTGIPLNIMANIFEPLYSTKVFGVGLGLSIVRQIMEQHGGGVQIDSEEGKGTTVTLWLLLT